MNVKNALSLFAVAAAVAGSASAQTLFDEGTGTFLSTSPVSVVGPFDHVGYYLNGSYSYRLSGQFDITGSLTYHPHSYAGAGASAGFTDRFSDSGWGVRSTLDLMTFKFLGRGQFFGTAGVGAMLFRQIDLSPRIQIFPDAQLFSGAILGNGDTDLNLSLNLGAATYLRVWREVRLFAAPSFPIAHFPSDYWVRHVSVGFGALVPLPD